MIANEPGPSRDWEAPETPPKIKLPTIELRSPHDDDNPAQHRIGRQAMVGNGIRGSLHWSDPDFDTRKGIKGTTSIELDGGFELTMTDELREGIKEFGGFAHVRKEFEKLTDQLLADPHGKTNIDHFKDTDAGLLARHVHAVTGPLSTLMGDIPLAIKATGLNVERSRDMGLGFRTNLRDQFRSTLYVRRQFEKASPDAMIDGAIGVADIYGVVRYRNPDASIQEWMLMEQIKDAEPMPNARIALASFGGPSVAFGFERADYPELAAFHDKHDAPWGNRYKRDLIEYEDIAKHLYKELGISKFSKIFDDLNGNNILVHKNPNGSQDYSLIDIQSH